MQYPGRIGSGSAMTTAPITDAILRQPLPAANRPPNYLPATPSSVLWGRLPCAADAPVLEIAPGATVVVDTISHEGILEDQGRDPVAFFGSQGFPPTRSSPTPSRFRRAWTTTRTTAPTSSPARSASRGPCPAT
ncbi:hypothetical protein ACFQV8_07210 [Pseudonocardia benzenivorans]